MLHDLNLLQETFLVLKQFNFKFNTDASTISERIGCFYRVIMIILNVTGSDSDVFWLDKS